MGRGSVQTYSSKQKLNTRSSTEAELVGVDDIMSQLMWTKYFLKAQGLKVKTKLLQDNKSTMLLKEKGIDSTGKRSRHINIRYFYIKDCLDKGYLSIEHCGTDDMIADIMTKPLQGIKFRKFQRMILNEHG